MTVETVADIRRQEAAAWFARLKQRRVESADIQAFSDWRRTPENAEAFARIEAMWDAAEVLAHDSDMAELTLAAARRGAPRPRSRIQTGWRPAAAALAAVAVLGSGLLWLMAQPKVYATDVGEQRLVRLADGSTVRLDTASRIAVRLRGRERRVELVSGQALFDVRHDAARPFVVEAGETAVTALGTRFDVRRLGAEVRVVLVEGRVRVDAPTGRTRRSWTLHPGQQVVPSAPSPVVTAVDAAQATSWTTGRLVFDRTPLRNAIAEVNRYSPTKIELRAGAVSGIPVSGAFDAGDLDGFVSAVTELYPIAASPAEDGVIVLRDAPKK
jgi:transmembrane sensor